MTWSTLFLFKALFSSIHSHHFLRNCYFHSIQQTNVLTFLFLTKQKEIIEKCFISTNNFSSTQFTQHYTNCDCQAKDEILFLLILLLLCTMRIGRLEKPSNTLELFSSVKVHSCLKHGATQTFSNSILEGEKAMYSCYHSLINYLQEQEMDGAEASHLYSKTSKSVQCWGVGGREGCYAAYVVRQSETSYSYSLQCRSYLVVVANIQMRTLKTEVE